MDPVGRASWRPPGLIDSKFGTVTLLRLIGGAEAASRLPRLHQAHRRSPHLRISGWSCQGDTLPARRAAISCMLNRLTLLTRRKRPETGRIIRPRRTQARDCATAAAPALSADWVTGADNPQLRGAF